MCIISVWDRRSSRMLRPKSRRDMWSTSHPATKIPNPTTIYSRAIAASPSQHGDTFPKTAQQQTTLTGSCLCGLSHYTATPAPIKMLICHCLNCKKWSGSAFGANIWVWRSSFSLRPDYSQHVRGYKDQGTDSGQMTERHFCSRCGCSLFSTVPGWEAVSITSGTVDHIVGIAETQLGGDEDEQGQRDEYRLGDLTPELEAYCVRRAPWVEIKGGIDRIPRTR